MQDQIQSPTIAFDHLFICTAIGAPEAEYLISLGLKEGRSNIHPGQGTANRCFFFRNFMLELLWVDNGVNEIKKLVLLDYVCDRIRLTKLLFRPGTIAHPTRLIRLHYLLLLIPAM
jgi:hypothetical protein